MKAFAQITTILLLYVTLAGCRANTSTATGIPTEIPDTPIIKAATPASTPAEPQATLTPTQPAPTLTPLPVEPTTTSTATLPPEDILTYRSLDISTGLPADVKPGSALLVLNEQLQLRLLHFDPQVWVEDFPGIDTACLSTSPDGNWLAYCPLSADAPTGQWLIVEAADRKLHYKVPMDIHLVYFGVYEWLDNKRLIFPLMRKEYEIHPMMVINPFTGEQFELASNYPDLQPDPGGITGSMQFNISDVVYDPTLDLVVYPQAGQHSYFVVWNRQTQTVVAKVEDLGSLEHYPLWSSDGKQLAVAATVQYGKQPGDHIDEWFKVSRDGEVEQLTHFEDDYVKAEILDGNWSPDGQKLAFWLETSPSLCPGVHLAILDIATQKVINDCFPGTFEYPPPIWSLNSRYISVVNISEESPQAILVDTEQDRAFDITEYGYPVGWLAIP